MRTQLVEWSPFPFNETNLFDSINWFRVQYYGPLIFPTGFSGWSRESLKPWSCFHPLISGFLLYALSLLQPLPEKEEIWQVDLSAFSLTPNPFSWSHSVVTILHFIVNSYSYPSLLLKQFECLSMMKISHYLKIKGKQYVVNNWCNMIFTPFKKTATLL